MNKKSSTETTHDMMKNVQAIQRNERLQTPNRANAFKSGAEYTRKKKGWKEDLHEAIEKISDRGTKNAIQVGYKTICE